ncbi:MAG: sulfate transporter, partial [Gemmatimonadetes bacterium]|nr:sulfate transporter [Gemmatimonadota bacterium]
IIRMRHVIALDSSGMHALADVVHRTRKGGTLVFLAEVHMQPLVALTGSAALEEIGVEHLFDSLPKALAAARDVVSQSRSGGTRAVRVDLAHAEEAGVIRK